MTQVLLFGSDHLGFRIIEQLRHDGCSVTAVVSAGSWLAGAQLPPDIRVLEGRTVESNLLKLAGAERAEILFAVTDQDEMNLGVTLAALEVNPSLRVVLRQFNVRLGQLIAKYLPQCEVLSMSALAAPTFALASLSPGVVYAHPFGEQTFVIHHATAGELKRQFGSPAGASHMKVIAAGAGDQTLWFPDPDSALPPDAKLLVATTERNLPQRQQINRTKPWRTKRLTDFRRHRMLIIILLYLAFLVTAASIYFMTRLRMTLLDAVYFVITMVTTVGFGDFSLRDADPLSKIIGITIMISGVMMTAVLFALVTNRMIARQQAFDQGQVKMWMRDHVVVCGLGVVGFRVAQTLRRLGQSVVVIESSESGRLIAQARGENIPVVIGNALQKESLIYANAPQAKALVVCTNPDYLNLEIALYVRSLIPGLPIVLRLFDPDLSRRVTTHFGLETTFSSASLAAPRFASSTTNPSRLLNLRFHNLDFEVRQVRVSSAETVETYCQRSGVQAIAIADEKGDLHFDVRGDRRVAIGDTLILAARQK